MYVRVVERRRDGIVVRGAKCHQTGALNSRWMLVMPTISMGREDADYAVCFVAPADAPGFVYVYMAADAATLVNLRAATLMLVIRTLVVMKP